MFGGNPFEKKVVPPVLENEQPEKGVEQEIDNEILSLENNLEGFKQDIENIGGEEALQKELENNDLLANSWKNRYNRTKMLLCSIILGASTTAIGFVDSQVLPQINWDLADDKKMGQYLATFTILGIIGTIAGFVEFIKNQKKVSATNKLISD